MAAWGAARSGTGDPSRDERTAVGGRRRADARRRAAVARLGPGRRATQSRVRRGRPGARERAFAPIRDAVGPALEVFPDGTSIRARQNAAGAGGGGRTARRPGSLAGRGRATRAVGACDARGLGLGLLRKRVCSSRRWPQAIADAGTEPCVPAKRTHPPVPHDRAARERRHRVEDVQAALSKAATPPHDMRRSPQPTPLPHLSQRHRIGRRTRPRASRAPERCRLRSGAGSPGVGVDAASRIARPSGTPGVRLRYRRCPSVPPADGRRPPTYDPWGASAERRAQSSGSGPDDTDHPRRPT